MVIMLIMKIMDLKIIMAKDLEEATDDKTTIDHVMEIIEVTAAMEMIVGGKAIETETIVGRIEITMMAKLRVIGMMEIIRTIERTDQEEIEMIIEMEEVAVMVGKEMVMKKTMIGRTEGVEETVMVGIEMMKKTMIDRTEGAEETVVKKTIMKMNRKEGKFIFHQSNLMTTVYLEMTCR